MKNTNAKQATMKGLLLLALLVNVSWQPALQALKSANLASNGELGGSNPPATEETDETEARPPMPTNPSGVGPSNKGVQPPKPVAVKKAAETRARTASPSMSQLLQSRHEELIGNACRDMKFIAQFTEVRNEQGEPSTSISVHQDLSDELTPIKVNLKGSFATNIGDETRRQDVIKFLIEKKIRPQLGDKCEPVRQASTRNERGSQKPKAVCTIDEETRKRLTSAEKAECMADLAIERLEELRARGLDTSDPKQARKFRADFNKIVTPELQKYLRNLALSKDSMTADAAKSRIDSIKESIREIQDDFDEGSEVAKHMNRVSDNLTGIEIGSNFFRRSLEAYEARRNNQMNPMQFQQVGTQLNQQWAQVMNFQQRTQAMNQDDLTLYQRPFEAFMGRSTMGSLFDQDGMLNGNLPSQQDVFSYRSQLRGQRTNGINIPQMPMQQPGVFGPNSVRPNGPNGFMPQGMNQMGLPQNRPMYNPGAPFPNQGFNQGFNNFNGGLRQAPNQWNSQFGPLNGSGNNFVPGPRGN